MMIEIGLVAYPRRVIDEVKSNVDAITTFPLRTEKPTIREMATGRRWSMSRRRVTAGHRAGAGRSHHDSRDHAGGRRERAALRHLDRGIGRRPAAARPDPGPGGRGRAPLVAEPAGRVGERSGGRFCCGRTGRRTVGRSWRILVLWSRGGRERLHLGDMATVVDGFEETDLGRPASTWCRRRWSRSSGQGPERNRDRRLGEREARGRLPAGSRARSGRTTPSHEQPAR